MTAGEAALREAITRYMQWIFQLSTSGKGAPRDEWDAPLFTYLLTSRQYNELKAICKREGWPPPDNQGITFNPHVLKHILTARTGKDSLSVEETASVLAASLSPRSTVAMQKSHDQQVVVLNSFEVLRMGQKREKYRGMLIVEVTINDLAPVTAYHASEAKSRAIMKHGKKRCNQSGVRHPGRFSTTECE